MDSKRHTYYQSEFKSFEHFIDFSSELMVTRTEIEHLLLQPTNILSSFFPTLEKKIIVIALYGLGERSFSKIKSLLNKSELNSLIHYCKNLKEPSTESQWAAQKEMLVKYERFLIDRADSKK